jgi:hypothetical protein
LVVTASIPSQQQVVPFWAFLLPEMLNTLLLLEAGVVAEYAAAVVVREVCEPELLLLHLEIKLSRWGPEGMPGQKVMIRYWTPSRQLVGAWVVEPEEMGEVGVVLLSRQHTELAQADKDTMVGTAA